MMHDWILEGEEGEYWYECDRCRAIRSYPASDQELAGDCQSSGVKSVS